MSRNIEIKARVVDAAALCERTAALADAGPTDIVQDDIFFNCMTGRLKLRTFADGSGELIFYSRPDHAGPKESFYLRAPTAAPGQLCEVLSLAHGRMGRVKKQRTLFLVGRTRVHLDRVEGLGQFVELEVVLDDDEAGEVGVREARDLMRKLGIGTDQLLDEAYVDLLSRQALSAPGER